jgi:OOP family OmpA-OmpF porin
MGEGMSTIRSVCLILLVSIASSLLLAHPSFAQESPFQNGWTLRRDASSIRFQTVKNVTKVESSTFAEFEGGIDETGAAKIRVFLDSVDTKIDLRNVRMRFLLFETFQFPEAVITAQIEPAQLSDLPSVKRKFIPLKFNVELHGVKASFDTEVSATLLNDDLVAISSTVPISLPTSAFNLDGGVKKLEEAAKVTIIPSATVSFDFVFAQNGAEAKEAEIVSATDSQLAASKALEPKGNLDVEACKGRFEILSRTDNIYFASGSARLDARSEPLLNSIVDIISRCPELIIEVSGHTDSDGSAVTNMSLSRLRAAAVAQYLASKNILKDRIRSVGYGETRPVASNQTAEGKHRNRRIEFAVVQ